MALKDWLPLLGLGAFAMFAMAKKPTEKKEEEEAVTPSPPEPVEALCLKIVDQFNKPVKGATVIVYNKAGKKVLTAVTSDDGVVYVRNISPKDVPIEVKIVYDNVRTSSRITRYKGQYTIQIRIPQDVHVVRVIDTAGKPVAGVTVRLMKGTKIIAQAVTGSDGVVILQKASKYDYPVVVKIWSPTLNKYIAEQTIRDYYVDKITIVAGIGEGNRHTVRFRVETDKGERISGARICLAGVCATTDSSGECIITVDKSKLPAVATLTVYFKISGRTYTVTKTTRVTTQVKNYTFIIQKPGETGGTVISGGPIVFGLVR